MHTYQKILLVYRTSTAHLERVCPSVPNGNILPCRARAIVPVQYLEVGQGHRPPGVAHNHREQRHAHTGGTAQYLEIGRPPPVKFMYDSLTRRVRTSHGTADLERGLYDLSTTEGRTVPYMATNSAVLFGAAERVTQCA